MNTNVDSQNEDLIDLGAASAETKGNQTGVQFDEVAGQYIKQPGIAQD